MEKYIGLKMVNAAPGKEPLNEDNAETRREGYLVVYPDGYKSWSPKDVFEAAYREVNAATYSIALEGVIRGEKWARKGWNGADMWIAIQVPDEHSKMKHPYIYMSPVGGKLVPWLCSQTDGLAEDWYRLAGS